MKEMYSYFLQLSHRGVSDSHSAKAPAPCLSGRNTLNVCTVLTERYRDAMGFTQEEVALLMEDCGVSDRLQELKQWIAYHSDRRLRNLVMNGGKV